MPTSAGEPVWFPTRDGTRLAARLWLPDGPPGVRFPAVLEAIPYRTFDRYRALDDRWGRILARQGLAFARVDIRGSGASEGLLTDEYLESEQQDAEDVIAWLAAQPWCNGAVGLRGISWGGFAALQVAARRPPALKAIAPMCATDMRFRNDAHYVGGMPGLTNLKWAAGFELVMASPPDPQVVGEAWEDLWRRRLEATPSIAARWLRHDWNDAYWRHGSVGLDPGAIACPTYVVGGWSDPYAQSAVRLAGALSAPLKVMIGPWGHIHPDLAQPGPGVDWATEEGRWWRHWLAGEANGVMEGPQVRYFIAHATPAEVGDGDIPGRWAASAQWPDPSIQVRRLYLAPGALSPTPARTRLSYRQEGVVGLATPEWIPYAPAERPRDQAGDDARSLVFDLPLAAPMELVGAPRLRLRLSSDRPLAAVAARLSEVDRQGCAWLVSYGLLNLAFRDGFTAEPQPLAPGRFYDIDVDLEPIAHRFKPGSTLRLSLSESLWPLVWPLAERPTLTLDLEGCALELPDRPIPPAEAPFPLELTHPAFSRGDPLLRIEEDAAGIVTARGVWPDTASTIAATGLTISGGGPDMELHYDPADRDSCRWRVRQTSRYRRGDWDCEVRTEILMTSTRDAFRIQDTLEALKNGGVIFTRTAKDVIPRRFA
ncbi:MAG TPA: CocE/NonD family hydrolase [Caulobacteraceae bacterium]|nr:CocE/NonD family hydrolase [Caulobacteraceae bacterium]